MTSTPETQAGGSGHTVEPPILAVNGLTKRFSRRTVLDRIAGRPGHGTLALDHVSLELFRGQALAVVGESGSGKTTLAHTIVRLIEPDAGTISFRQEDVLGASKGELASLRRRVQLVYQDPFTSLNGAMTIGQAIIEPALVHGLISKSEAPGRLSELMEQVGLNPALADRKPRALSGGQRQRVAIARSLAAEPEVLIADEAVSALDVSVQIQVITLLARLQAELGLTMIFISHQLAIVAQLCEDVAIMYRGQIVEQGPTREVFRSPRHGYTAELIQAHPGGRRMRSRSGSVAAPPSPPPMDQPGCPFRHRCAFTVDVCSTTTPEPIRVSERWTSCCHVLPLEPSVAAAAGIDHQK